MSDRGRPGGTELDEPSKRLESWKEIASYLDRSPRTVRRWEAEEGLPVHRHQHSKGNTVFAYPEELDGWLVSRVARSQTTGPPLPPAAALVAAATDRREPRGSGWGGAAPRLLTISSLLALAIAAAALVLSLAREDPVDPLGLWIRSIPVEKRLLLEASYFDSRGDREAALRAIEAVAGVGPVGPEAIRLGLSACHALGDPERCGRLARRAADQAPEDAVLQATAAVELSRAAGGIEAGLGYAERALALSVADPSMLDPDLLAFVELLPARKAWLDGDVAVSAAELDRLAARAEALSGAGLDAVARAAGQHCLALGTIERARGWFARIGDRTERYELESYALFAAGRMEELATHLAAESEYRSPETAILLAMTGNGEAARRLIERLDGLGADAGALEVARGALALLAGRAAQAAPELASGVARVSPPGSGMHFIALDLLSRIAEQEGRPERAVELLRMTDQERGRAALLGSGLFWIKCQTRLAEVYRQMGRDDEALRVERELLTALALSDPDHPTTAALKRRSA